MLKTCLDKGKKIAWYAGWQQRLGKESRLDSKVMTQTGDKNLFKKSKYRNAVFTQMQDKQNLRLLPK
jgi:hypothetical protein